MELKDAIQDLKEFIEYAQNMINDMEYERPVDVTVYQHNLNSIDTVLEELNNRIPRKDIEDMGKKINSELAMCRNYRANQIVIKKYFERLLNKE